MSTNTPLKSIKPSDSNNKESIEILNNSQNVLSIKKDNEHETIEIKQATPPSLFVDFKKSLGLEVYSDGSFILYFFLTVFVIQKANDVFKFIRNILLLPKQLADTYNFITREDLILLDKIDNLMNQLLGMLDADRIAVAKIHNGTYDHTNAHLMKFSMIYEVISERVSSEKAKVQNIPINYIKEEISLGSINTFQRIDRTNLQSKCDIYLDSIGLTTKYFKLLAINNNSNNIYGIVEIHFVNIPTNDFIIDKALSKRVYKIMRELEDCFQTILLKRTWIQKTISKAFNINNLFKG